MDWRWPLAALAAALSLMTAPAAFAAGSDPPASAGWHGREIRDPLPRPTSPSSRPQTLHRIPTPTVSNSLTRSGALFTRVERLVQLTEALQTRLEDALVGSVS